MKARLTRNRHGEVRLTLEVESDDERATLACRHTWTTALSTTGRAGLLSWTYEMTTPPSDDGERGAA